MRSHESRALRNRRAAMLRGSCWHADEGLHDRCTGRRYSLRDCTAVRFVEARRAPHAICIIFFAVSPKVIARAAVNPSKRTPSNAHSFSISMSLPIVIADDSLLARKVLTKALPEDL